MNRLEALVTAAATIEAWQTVIMERFSLVSISEELAAEVLRQNRLMGETSEILMDMAREMEASDE